MEQLWQFSNIYDVICLDEERFRERTTYVYTGQEI